MQQQLLRRICLTLSLAVPLLAACPSAHARALLPAAPPTHAAETGAKASPATGDAGPGVPFTPEKLSALLPATVYFQGKSAPLQIRNAGGAALNGDQILWASLVDTSGYSSSVQERYQFYLVSEGPFRIGGVAIPAGAYGAGFLGDHFLIMDLGGHTVSQGPLQNDANLRRPRPLQVLADGPASVKLYLGRHWVLLQADSAAAKP